MATVTHSLVVPVYLNEQSLPAVIDTIARLQEDIGSPVEGIFVVDGSPDRSYEILRTQLPRAAFASQLVLLSRNFGSFAAIRAGLRRTSGAYHAVMSADLQEPRQLIAEFFQRLQADEADVVVGVRAHRDDPAMTRIASRVFWRLYRRLVMREMPAGGVDVFACTSEVRDQLVGLSEARSSLVAQLYWVGFRRLELPYRRQPRHAGTSAWTFRKKLNYLTDSVFAFTDLPIRLLTMAGLAGLCVSVVMGAITLSARLLGSIAVPGYTVTVGLLLLFGSLNLFGLGLVGSYAWRAYENTKGRPEAIVARLQRFDGESP